MVGTCHYEFPYAYGMYNSKSEVSCKPWILYINSVFKCSSIIKKKMHHPGEGCFNGGRLGMYGSGNIWKISVPSAQFFLWFWNCSKNFLLKNKTKQNYVSHLSMYCLSALNTSFTTFSEIREMSLTNIFPLPACLRLYLVSRGNWRDTGEWRSFPFRFKFSPLPRLLWAHSFCSTQFL